MTVIESRSHLGARVCQLQQLGFECRFYNEQGGLDKKNVLKAIKEIVASNREKYPELNPNTNLLQYDNIENFAISYLLMLQNMSF